MMKAPFGNGGGLLYIWAGGGVWKALCLILRMHDNAESPPLV